MIGDKFMQPVVDRMRTAATSLLTAAKQAENPDTEARLKAKAEGVMLARSYLEEAVREIPDVCTLTAASGVESWHIDFGYLGKLYIGETEVGA